MNIGIDVDGVLVDMESYQMKYGKRYFEDKLGMKKKNPAGYDIEDIYGCTHEQREKFWTKYIWRYCLWEPMTAQAAETVKKLHENGHRITIITGRAHTTEKGITGKLFRWMLRHWLKKNHFYYDELIFCSEKGSSSEKYDICMQKKIDLLLDDKPENLLPLKDKIKVLCYPAAWNKDCLELDGVRIEKFEDILLE